MWRKDTGMSIAKHVTQLLLRISTGENTHGGAKDFGTDCKGLGNHSHRRGLGSPRTSSGLFVCSVVT